ncbi:Uncharacterised protein [Mycobacteroides abscessus subsp. abscessus]|nr:Uncharacterised protein [Mycobacteroides abscessus subsp. abscessus]
MKSYARADVKELTPAVGSLGGPQQLLAQLAQLVLRRTFLHSGCDILGRTSGLIDPIGQVGGFVSGEHHRIRGYRGALDRRPLLVGTLSAGLAAILASPTQLGVVDFTPAPLAGLSVFATCHVQQRSGGPFPRSRTAPVKPTPLGRRIVPVGQTRCGRTHAHTAPGNATGRPAWRPPVRAALRERAQLPQLPGKRLPLR